MAINVFSLSFFIKSTHVIRRMETNGNGNDEGLPPPPPPPAEVPPNVVPVKADELPPEPVKKKPSRFPIARKGLGTKGSKLQLLTNHFKVDVNNKDGHFFHYSVRPFCFSCLSLRMVFLRLSMLSRVIHLMHEQVALFYEDGRPVEGKGAGRKVLDRVQETYSAELDGKNFAYDGEKSLFTVGSLPRNKLEFTVVLDDVVSSRLIFLSLFGC